MPHPALPHRRSSAFFSLVLSLVAAGCGGQVLVPGESGGAGTGTAGGAGGGSGGFAGEGGGSTTSAPCLCMTDADCGPNTVCKDCACQAECFSDTDCGTGQACCGGACTDTSSDPNHCGACDSLCALPNATAWCEGGSCAISACNAGFSDCDGALDNGCEVQGSGCLCSPGEVTVCYEGPADTQNVGVCAPGIAVCLDGVAWGPCEGQTLPSPEQCDGLDNDCDGHDDTWDQDGDGFSACDGDCCETTACAPSPALLNPGAMEYPGNGLDDDCDTTTHDEDPFPDCTGPALDVPTSSLELLKAMDVCQATVENPPALKDKRWGLISLWLSLADGTGEPDEAQKGVLSSYGQVLPKRGTTLAALSSGTARDEDDPDYAHPQNGYVGGQLGNYVAGTAVSMPADFLAANGGAAPSPCFTCSGNGCTTAFDSVALRARLRAPTNSDSFRFFASFYSAEYPESICSKFDDFFVALVDSQASPLPADKNVALDLGNPISVNTALFRSCAYPTCDLGASEIVGTGMGGWDGTLLDGASTSWIKIESKVVPGETFEIRWMIWDGGDGNVDSLVLLDGFRFQMIGEGFPPGP